MPLMLSMNLARAMLLLSLTASPSFRNTCLSSGHDPEISVIVSTLTLASTMAGFGRPMCPLNVLRPSVRTYIHHVTAELRTYGGRYEQQKNEILPFNDGLLLNLDASRPTDLTNIVLGADAQNKAATEGVFQRSIFDKFGCGSLTNTVTTLPRHLIENLVDDMVVSSTILPLREIRQNATISQQMQAELVDLLVQATLDFGQLVNFIDSLRNPVHCTQGPPGTGKSYLGVQIVYALTIIRKYCMQQNKSVGTPPILVLLHLLLRRSVFIHTF